MPRPRRPQKSSEDVEKLLNERQAVTEWLERLALTGDDASDEVRSKVREDYETRLAAASKGLQGYADELRSTLSKETKKRSDFLEREQRAEGRLDEAKLRHAVGEYEDSQWNEIHSEILGELVKVREGLKAAGKEIDRLEDVLSSIDRRPTEDQEEPEKERVSIAEIEPEPDGAGVAGGGAEKESKPAGRTSGQTDAFDDLAFLKKVAPEAAGKKRRSGAMFKPFEGAGTAADKPGSTVTAPEEKLQVGPAEDPTAKKTLKCQECGAMNRPTEWYCESCGAELAAV
ncbi:MAG: hypothetical protein IID06_09950 [Gemmatimonadetes bacterium]|nr:hypothetical protein [Gemmatimonadota bacterium]